MRIFRGGKGIAVSRQAQIIKTGWTDYISRGDLMETVEAGGVIFYIVRSKRKTICLRVRDDGTAEMAVPFHIPSAELRPYAEKYAAKIAALQQKKLAQLHCREAFRLDYGFRLQVLGKEILLLSKEGNRAEYSDTAYYVPPSMSAEQIKHAVIRLYRLHAKNYISRRVAALSERMGAHPISVKINAATSRWASCSAKNTLNFSWFLMMAEPETVDYVIIHELCHMRYFNHSSAFWNEVARYCPDYARHKQYLKQLAQKIHTENWKLER